MSEQNVMAALAGLTPPSAVAADTEGLPAHLVTWVDEQPAEKRADALTAARASITPGAIAGAPAPNVCVADAPAPAATAEPAPAPAANAPAPAPARTRGRPQKTAGVKLLEACAHGGLSVEVAKQYLVVLGEL